MNCLYYSAIPEATIHILISMAKVDINMLMKNSYVLVAATSTFFINTLHVVLTSKARKASGLKYPVPYASNDLAEKDETAFKFNCGMSMLDSLLNPSQIITIANSYAHSPTWPRQLH